MKQQEEKMLTKYLSRFYKECLKSVGSLENSGGLFRFIESGGFRNFQL